MKQKLKVGQIVELDADNFGLTGKIIRIKDNPQTIDVKAEDGTIVTTTSNAIKNNKVKYFITEKY